MRRALIGLVALLFLACGEPQRRAYLLADRAVAASLGGPSALESLFRAAVVPRGLEAALLIPAGDEDINAAMEKALADPRTALAVCLSSVPVDLAAWAQGHPQVLFAGYGAPADAKTQARNDLRLVPGRADAYREAGRRLGELVGATGEPGGSVVGILAVSPTAAAGEEIKAFRDGLAGAKAKEPQYRESRSLTDKTAALRELREMRDGGARYFLLKTYGLTTACLEAVEQEGDHAVVEDCGRGAGCGVSVILSIETDWGRTLAGVLAAAGDAGWSASTLSESWTVRAGAGSPP